VAPPSRPPTSPGSTRCATLPNLQPFRSSDAYLRSFSRWPPCATSAPPPASTASTRRAAAARTPRRVRALLDGFGTTAEGRAALGIDTSFRRKHSRAGRGGAFRASTRSRVQRCPGPGRGA
jgi:hypothetical protein